MPLRIRLYHSSPPRADYDYDRSLFPKSSPKSPILHGLHHSPELIRTELSAQGVVRYRSIHGKRDCSDHVALPASARQQAGSTATEVSHSASTHLSMPALSLAALGVVFGDIWHQSALYAEDSAWSDGRRALRPTGGLRRAVTDPVDPDHRHLAEIRHLRPACGQ